MTAVYTLLFKTLCLFFYGKTSHMHTRCCINLLKCRKNISIVRLTIVSQLEITFLFYYILRFKCNKQLLWKMMVSSFTAALCMDSTLYFSSVPFLQPAGCIDAGVKVIPGVWISVHGSEEVLGLHPIRPVHGAHAG